MTEPTPGPWKREITEEGRAVIDLGENHKTWFRWLCPSRGDMETFEGVDLATLDLAALAPDFWKLREIAIDIEASLKSEAVISDWMLRAFSDAITATAINKEEGNAGVNE